MGSCAPAGEASWVLLPHCPFLPGLNHHAAMLLNIVRKESLSENMLGGTLCTPPPQPAMLLFKDF